MLVLRPLKPFVLHLGAEPHDVVEVADRLDPDPVPSSCVGVARPVGAAMRPVDLQPVADRPAEHLVDRHAERLGLDVDQRVLDRGDRHRVDAAGGLPGRGVEIGRVALDRPRVLPDQPLAELADDAGQPLRAIALHVFRPADDALVGGDLQKRIDPPAGVAMQVFDRGDFHDRQFLQEIPQSRRKPGPLIRIIEHRISGTPAFAWAAVLGGGGAAHQPRAAISASTGSR